jgi:hypothetical protein
VMTVRCAILGAAHAVLHGRKGGESEDWGADLTMYARGLT